MRCAGARSNARLLLPLFLALAGPRPVRAWGERGHHAIARLAAVRVTEGASDSPEMRALAALFSDKAIELGHLANIPDTAWRSDPAAAALNAPTHFMNTEQYVPDIAVLPLDYAQALALYQGKPGRLDGRPVDLFASGTLMWRAQQLYELMVSELRTAGNSPAGSEESSAAVQRALIYGGLLGHFIGDATMPYHACSDHDGYATGNGGIHAYFETEAPNTDDPSLELRVYEEIPKTYAALRVEESFAACPQRTAACLARQLLHEAHDLIPNVATIDDGLLLERSRSAVLGNPSVPGRRKPASEGEAAFRDTLVAQWSAAAAVLARLWRGAWEAAGRPDLSKIRIKDYAHKPEFVLPLYDPQAVLGKHPQKRAESPKTR